MYTADFHGWLGKLVLKQLVWDNTTRAEERAHPLIKVRSLSRQKHDALCIKFQRAAQTPRKRTLLPLTHDLRFRHGCQPAWNPG